MEKVVCVILINNKMQLLMYLRDDKTSIPYPNYWAVLGGHVEKNESLWQALRREIKEEIDYKLSKKYYLGRFYDKLGECLVYVYKSKINKNISSLILTEGQKLGYFSFDEVLKLKIPEPLREFLIKNKERILNKKG